VPDRNTFPGRPHNALQNAVLTAIWTGSDPIRQVPPTRMYGGSLPSLRSALATIRPRARGRRPSARRRAARSIARRRTCSQRAASDDGPGSGPTEPAGDHTRRPDRSAG
jgi:hypothetical protein